MAIFSIAADIIAIAEEAWRGFQWQQRTVGLLEEVQSRPQPARFRTAHSLQILLGGISHSLLIILVYAVTFIIPWDPVLWCPIIQTLSYNLGQKCLKLPAISQSYWLNKALLTDGSKPQCVFQQALLRSKLCCSRTRARRKKQHKQSLMELIQEAF